MTSRFPLLRCDPTRDELMAEAAALLCNVDPSLVEDIFPCTPWQEACLTRAADSQETRLSRYQWELPENVDKMRLKAAVEAVIKSTPVLRTRIVRLPDCGLVNVVVRHETVSWTETTLLQTCIPAEELAMSARITGVALSRCGFVGKGGNGIAYFVWALHPAIHDNRTLSLVLEAIGRRYSGLEPATLLPFRLYSEFVHSIDESRRATEFWKAQLSGSSAVSLPNMAENASHAQADKNLQHFVAGPLKSGTDDSIAAATTMIWMAWAILTARYTDSDHVIFGATLNGRQAEFPGIDRIAGPTTCMVPIQTAISWQSTVTQFRRQIQRQAVEMVPYAHCGMHNASLDAERVSKFHSLIVVNSTEHLQVDSSALLRTHSGDVAAAACCPYDKYALALTCQVHTGGVKFDMRFDSSIVQERVAQRMLEQLGYILRLICSPSHGDCTLLELEMASPQDLHDIWSWNSKVPAPIHGTVHTVIAETTARQPDAPAVCAWDGHLTYAELDEFSTRLAYCIIDLGIVPESIIPLCFEKSMWTAVAMLAVMKTGAACVALDLTNPLLRLKSIVERYKRKLILCSQKHEATAKSLDFSTVLIVDADSIPRQTATPTQLPQVSPSQTVFITYTSGSTGTPKGACISHSNVCTASHYQGFPLGFRTTSRVLDFAPYSFDVAWSNVLHTLCAGGCLCVASRDEMMDDIQETLCRYRVNFINITPSALRALTPEGAQLQDVLLSGERPDSNLLSQWMMEGRCIKNTYGPAECTFKSAFATVSHKNVRSPDIGRPLGVCGWLVCPERDDRLAMIGQVGELLLEGPLVGQGYWGDATSTSAAFIQDPPWLLRGGPGVVGRRGRLYKTGDLMRYNADDGTLQFVGRKDAQVKIRGQRVELGEVEHHVQKHLAATTTTTTMPAAPLFAAELISPKGTQNAMLVVFISLPRKQGKGTSVAELTLGLNEKLADVLPRYMIPSSYVTIQELPMTGTGKINRRELRRIGSTLTLQQLLAAS